MEEKVLNSVNSGLKWRQISRFSSINLVLGGLLYILLQFIHPAENLETVLSHQWLMVALLTLFMGIVIFMGLLGLYFLYSDKIPLWGLLGLFLFNIFCLLTICFSFVEALVLPLLVDISADFVQGMLGLFSNEVSTVNLGLFPALVSLAGLFYIAGGFLLGLSGYKAQLPQKYAFLFLSLASLATILAGILGHPLDRFLALPMGIAFIWLGLGLWPEK